MEYFYLLVCFQAEFGNYCASYKVISGVAFHIPLSTPLQIWNLLAVSRWLYCLVFWNTMGFFPLNELRTWFFLLLERNTCQWSVTELFVFFLSSPPEVFHFLFWCAVLIENNIVMITGWRVPWGPSIISFEAPFDMWIWCVGLLRIISKYATYVERWR